MEKVEIDDLREVLKDDMTGKVKVAQKILSDIQLGMIQLPVCPLVNTSSLSYFR